MLDRLDPDRLAAFVHFLEAFLDEKDESLSPLEAAAIAEADEWSKHNQPIAHEDVLADSGVTLTHCEEMSSEP